MSILKWLWHGGPLNGLKRQIGILLWLLSKAYPELAIIDLVDGISDAELLMIWGVIDAELKRSGLGTKLATLLAKLLKKIT